MVKIIPKVMVQKYDTSVSKGGGGKDQKGSIIRVLEKNVEPTVDKDGMDMLSMVVSIVERMYSGVFEPLGSYYVNWSKVTIFPS